MREEEDEREEEEMDGKKDELEKDYDDDESEDYRNSRRIMPRKGWRCRRWSTGKKSR